MVGGGGVRGGGVVVVGLVTGQAYVLPRGGAMVGGSGREAPIGKELSPISPFKLKDPDQP